MPSKKYSSRYRKLKAIYSRSLGKDISDTSWYRVVSEMRISLKFDLFDPNAPLILRKIALLKRTHRNFRISGNTFQECWQLFQEYYYSKKCFTCAEFLLDLGQKLDLTQVSRTTKYNWFQDAGVPYKSNKTYPTKDLAIVAFLAVKSIASAKLKRTEKAAIVINSYAITTN